MTKTLLNTFLLVFVLSKVAVAKESSEKEEEPFRVTQLKELMEFARASWPSLQGEASWPKDFNGLFQGIRLPLKDKVIGLIPDNLMKGKVIGATIESAGWYYSSIESKDSTKPTWDNIVASKKGQKFLQFGFTW